MRSKQENLRRLRGDEFGIGVFLMAASVVLGLALAATQPAGEVDPLWERSLEGAALTLLVGYPSQLLIRTGVTVDKEMLLLRNRWVDISVPYEVIQRLTTSDGLTVELKDGRILRSAAVPRYLGGKLTGYQSAKRMRRAVQPRLTPAEPAPPELDIQRQVRFSWGFIVAALALHGIWYLLLLSLES